MSQLQSHLRYHGPVVSITDVCCRPLTLRPGNEERATVHQMVFPRAGVFVMHVGRQQIVADPNHAVFFNANEPYRVSHPVLGGDDCTSFDFPSATVLEVLASYEPKVRDRPQKPFRFNHVPIEVQTVVRQQRLRRKLQDGSVTDLEVEESALDLLNAVTRHFYHHWRTSPPCRRAETLRAHREWVESVKLLMSERVADNLSLTEIARIVYCSPFHLARLFRALTGFSLHEYQLRLRLALALERLVDGAVSLTDLALDLGFCSHSHFTAAFHRRFGISPSVFRGAATGACIRKLSKIVKV